MSIYLPSPVRIFFDPRNRGHIHVLEDCFTPDAVVVAEGRTHGGIDAVRQWMRVSSASADETITPASAIVDGATCEVTTHVMGTTAHGATQRRYVFTLHGARIAMLEIHA